MLIHLMQRQAKLRKIEDERQQGNEKAKAKNYLMSSC